jgi:hypothetical protein
VDRQAVHGVQQLSCLLDLLCVAVDGDGQVIVGSAPPGIVLHLKPRLLHYSVFSYPQVSGHYALFSLNTPNWGDYVLYDDRTGTPTRLTPPDGCQLWTPGGAFGAPWALFYCASDGSFELYNVESRTWRAFPCTNACENIGTAAPVAMGSHWVAINEQAYCDPRYYTCTSNDIEYVSIPDATVRTYTPSRRRSQTSTRRCSSTSSAHR